MRIWTRLEDYKKNPSRPLVLALGNFDGVHVGHQRILQRVVERGRKLQGVPSVLTFAEHPQKVLGHRLEPELLTSPQHRLLLLQELGIEACFLLHFTVAFSKTDAETFVKKWLVEKLGIKEMHSGYNAHFGCDRKGGVPLMKNLSNQLGFEFYEAEPVKVGEEFVSSSLTRRVIREGDLAKARELLGRPFSIFASVIHGKGRGKTLGFPTANLRPHGEILPPRGVYPVEVRESVFHLKSRGDKEEFEFVVERPGEWLPGVLNYGSRPTFEARGPEIPEVFLLNYSGDLYGKTVEVLFRPKLRDEREFESSAALARAIGQDVEAARRYFKNTRQTGLYK